MMNLFYRLLLCSTVFLCSCSKKDCCSVDCLPILPAFDIQFQVLNAEGEDVFFGEHPAYIIDQFKVLRKAGGNEVELPFSIEEHATKSIKLSVPPSHRDTCYLVFSANEVDTLVYFGSQIQEVSCPGLQIDSIYVNNKKVLKADNSGIYSFRK